MTEPLTDADFRAVGYTGAAINFPLSDAGFGWLCRVWNGIAPEQAPRAWRYAPSKAARRQIERYAAEGCVKRDGRAVKP